MKAIARAKTWHRVLAASVALTAVCGFSETPDYFVEWVQPSAALHVDTGVRGKVGVKAEVQFIHRSSPTFPVLLGFWGGNKKRFNLVMHWNEQGRWEYGDQMNNLGGFPWYGLLTTVSVEVPANGAMSCTWTNTEGGSMNHTMNATATYGLLDTETTLTLFASHYKDASSESFNLYSLVECLTQRRRETESAEKSQKSERKERYDKKRPENFFHPIGENNYDAN